MTQDHDAEQRALAEVAALRDLLGRPGLGGPGLGGPAHAAGSDDDAAVAAILARAAADADDPADDPADAPAPAPVVPLRPARRRWAVAAGIAAAAAVGVTIALLPTQDLPTAVASGSPPMLAYPVPPAELAAVEGEPAHDALLDLAAVAADQVDPEPAGTVQHVLAQSWLPSTTGDLDGDAVTAIEPTVRETWVTADGALTAAEWRGADLRLDGLLEAVDTTPADASVDELPAGSVDVDLVADLPLEPTALRSRLLELAGGDAVGCGPATADGAWCVYQAVTVLEAYVLPSALESALWSVLADEPGVGLSGEVTDRSGRRALGFSVPAGALDADPVVRLLLVDTGTGRLSGREEVTLSSEVMDIDEPTVTTFRYELVASWVAEVGGPGAG